MSTDIYPQEEGALFDAESYIVPAYPDGAITEMAAVKAGTTVAGRISVAAGAALGDSYAIALKAASDTGVPSRIPIILFGIVKVALTATHTATTGALAMNNTTTTFTSGASIGTLEWEDLLAGSSHVMGILVQGGGGPAAARSDEVLLCVGRVA